MPTGTPNDDVIIGTIFGDLIAGGAGDDELIGLDGDDELLGEDGDDRLWGGPGADRLDGGAGRDTAVYRDATAGVTIDLTLAGPQVSAGEANGDVLVSIENVTGSAYGDVLVGNAEDNTLRGGAGADLIDGGAGLRDRASYAFSDAAVDVDLNRTGPQIGGDAEGDTLTGIEDLIGSSHDDRLVGDGNDNGINGGAGADWIDGGLGRDTVRYVGSPEGVDVNLSRTGPQSGGDAEGDVLVSIENVHGSSYDDLIVGNDGQNWLSGAGGNDTIIAGDKDTIDQVYAGAGDDVVTLLDVANAYGGDGYDRLLLDFRNAETQPKYDSYTGTTYEAGRRTAHDVIDHRLALIDQGSGPPFGHAVGFEEIVIEGSEGRDVFVDTPGDDVIRGNGGNDWIESRNGADVLDGGAGIDTLRIQSPFTRNDLTIDVANGILPGEMTVTGFERISVTLSEGNDTVIGLDGDSGEPSLYPPPRSLAAGDYISTGYGDDFVDARGGRDHIRDGVGNDTVHGGDGDDVIFAQEGNDILYGDAGVDVFAYVGGGSKAGTGHDRIEDFSTEDRLWFGAGRPQYYDVVLDAASQTDEGVLISFGFGDESVLLVGWALDELDPALFEFGY